MFARTERLLLRPGWREDAGQLAHLLADGTVARNVSRMPHPYNEIDALSFLSREKDPLLPSLLIFSRTQASPRLIGGCGLHRAEDGTAELGYWIGRAYWGLGFATEASRALLCMARACGHRVVRAGHFVDNPASGKVLRKLGFRPTGVFEHRPCLARGEDVLMAVFESDGEAAMRCNDDVADELYHDAHGVAA